MRETEKMHKQLEAYMKENGSDNMSEEQMNNLLEGFVKQYNSMLPQNMTPSNAETSDDYLELAENARSEKEALQYAQTALELEPDNLDAERIVATAGVKDPLTVLDNLHRAVIHGTEVMKSEGFMTKEYIGDFWGVVETRPYMRLRHEFVETLIEAGMFRKAAAECEDMIRLCENDNLGVRYTLMHLYAYLEDERAALRLYKKYDGHEETQMLLPLSILYFKLYEMDKAKDYLVRLSKANKDTKKFFRAVRQDKIDEYADEMQPFGYRPFTIEELIMEVTENEFLFSAVPGYFWWADKQLVVKRKNS